MGNNILLLLTKQYQDLLNPFMYLFNRYFGNDNVLVFMDYAPDIRLESNFTYHQVPAYKGGWNWYQWFSNGLSSIFESLDFELYLIFFPDQWIYAPVDRKLFNQLVDYTLKDEDVIRANVTANTCLQTYNESIVRYKDLDIIRCLPDNGHCGLCITFCPSLFRKFPMESGWSLWQCESECSKMDYKVIGTKQSILYRQHVCSHHQPFNLFINKELYNMNVIKPMVKSWNLNYM